MPSASGRMPPEFSVWRRAIDTCTVGPVVGGRGAPLAGSTRLLAGVSPLFEIVLRRKNLWPSTVEIEVRSTLTVTLFTPAAAGPASASATSGAAMGANRFTPTNHGPAA